MDPEAESRETQMEPTPVPRSEEAAVDEGTLSGATSTTPLTAALLAPARATLRDWTLRRYLSAKSKEPPPPCVLYANSTVGEALTLFAEKGILSAPVLDCLKGQEATNWLGFLDVADIVHCLLSELFPWLLDEPHRSTAHGMMAALKEDSLSVTEALQQWAKKLFLMRWVKTVRPGGDGDMIYTGLLFRSLLELVTFGLQHAPTGVHPGAELMPSHRCAVFDVSDGGEGEQGARDTLHFTHIVSQSDIISFLLFHAQRGELGELPSKTVAQLGWMRGSVVCVPLEMPALACFALMMNRGISGVGVVTSLEEEDSALLGSLSISDVVVLSAPPDFDALALPVGQFLTLQYGGKPFSESLAATACDVSEAMQKMGVSASQSEVAVEQVELTFSKAYPVDSRGWSQNQLWLVKVTPESTFLEVLSKMVNQAVHRVYVVDALGRPLDVITMSDVLQMLAVDPQNDPEGWLTDGQADF